MLLTRLEVSPEELREATGWEIKPEGACKGDQCVPLPGPEIDVGTTVDVRAFARHMQMPIAADGKHGLFALGPPAGGHVLDSAVLPPVVLPDFEGNTFDVSDLRGRKVLLLAWASW